MEQRFETVFEYLRKVLPHGSGIDCDWRFTKRKNGAILASNSFHCMNETGYYVGYADFTVEFKNALQPGGAFVLTFNGKQSAYLNNRYMLREYLEEIIYEVFPRDKALLVAACEALTIDWRWQ